MSLPEEHILIMKGSSSNTCTIIWKMYLTEYQLRTITILQQIKVMRTLVGKQSYDSNYIERVITPDRTYSFRWHLPKPVKFRFELNINYF